MLFPSSVLTRYRPKIMVRKEVKLLGAAAANETEAEIQEALVKEVGLHIGYL